MVEAGLHDHLEGLLVGAGHHDHVGRAGLGHHLRLQVAAVHRLEVGHDRGLREGLAEGADAVEALGEDERGARLEPVNPCPHGHRGRFQGLIDVREV